MPRRTRPIPAVPALLASLALSATALAGGAASAAGASPLPAASLPVAAAALDESALDDAALILVANDNGSGNIGVFRGDGKPLPASSFPTGYDGDAQVAAGNLLGTREALEVAVALPSGRAQVFDLSTGVAAGAAFPVTFDVGDLMAAGDVDNDGVDELLIANDKEAGGGRVDVFDVATKTFKPGFGVPDTTLEDDPTNGFGAGDVDSDGRVEVFVANRDEGRIDILDTRTGKAKQDFGIPDTHFDDDDDNEFAVGDVTGDGRVEVVVARADGGELDVHDTDTGQELPGVGAGDTTFDNSSENQLKVADVDGDGKGEGLIANGGGPAGDLGRIDVIDLDTGLGQAEFGVPQTVSGFGPNDVMAVTTVDLDIDRDGIPDRVEMAGLRRANGSTVLDLPGLGASPCRRDIVVEIDWMDGSDGHSHRPRQDANGVFEALEDVRVAMADGNVDSVSPCPYRGKSDDDGINLISIVSNAVPEQTPVEIRADGTGKSDVDRLKDAHFDSGLDAYDEYVHWSLWLHDYAENGTVAVAGGRASPSETAFNDDQDFLVTVGGGTQGAGDRETQALTYMHELGHVIGLSHGGDVNVNCKPNYLSVMNYSFALSGLVEADGDRALDFSREDLDDLSEKDLVEKAGVGSDLETTLKTVWLSKAGTSLNDDADGALDWSGDGDEVDPVSDSAPQVVADLNGAALADADGNGAGCDDPQSESDNNDPDDPLTGHDDWALLEQSLDPVPFEHELDGPADVTGLDEPTPAEAAAWEAIWDQALLPDLSVQPQPAVSGFRSEILSLAVDGDRVFAVAGYRSTSTPPAPTPRGTLVVLDRQTLTVQARIPLGVGARAVAVNPRTGRAYALSLDATGTPGKNLITVVDTATLAVLARVETTNAQALADIAVNPRTNRVYLSHTGVSRVEVLDGATNAVLPGIEIGPGPQQLAVDEATNTVYVAMSKRPPGETPTTAVGRFVDDGVNPPVVLPRTDLPAAAFQPVDVTLDPTGDRVYVGSLGGGGVQPTVTAVRRSTMQVLDVLPVPGPVRQVATNPDTDLLFAASDRGLFTIDAGVMKLVRRAEIGILFSVATGTGATRDVFTGEVLSGTVSRLSHSSGEAQ